MRIFTLILSVFPISIASQVSQAAVHAFVTCTGKITNSNDLNGSMPNGKIEILPYKEEGGLAGDVLWKAIVTIPSGKYEVKPVSFNYSLRRQVLTFAYAGSDGSFELGVGLDRNSRIRGDERGDFGITLTNQPGLTGLKMRCKLSKYLVD